MSNFLYDNFRGLCLTAGINMSSDTIVVSLVDSSAYTPSSAHTYFSSVAGGAIISGPSTLGSKTTTGGAFDAADVTFSAVSGASIEGILIYKDTGSSATSPLIAWIDTATGLPITPNGGDIICTWDNGTNKIFRV